VEHGLIYSVVIEGAFYLYRSCVFN